MTLRSQASELAYNKALRAGKTVPLGKERTIWKGWFWKIIVNAYPPDMVFKPSMSIMLLPKRKFSEWWQMLPWEAVEFLVILYRYRAYGSQMTLNSFKTRSVRDHFHVHFNEFYDDREEIRL